MKPRDRVQVVGKLAQRGSADMENTTDIPTTRVAVVYYIQWADRIKIGTSRNLPGRLESLPYDRLLAIEPGGHATEHMRHLEFRTHRQQGEWFIAAPALLAHIEGLVTRYGQPRPAYVRWITGDTP